MLVAKVGFDTAENEPCKVETLSVYRSPRYDIDDSGEIDTLETSKALRAFGYPTSIEVVQDTIREVDVDGSGEMDLAEFLKIIRIFRNREMWKLLKQFERKNMDSAEGGKES